MAEPVTAVKFLDLAAQFAQVEAPIRAAIDDILSKQGFIGGPYVERAEADVLAYCGMPDGAAIAVSSGTDALLAVLMAMGVGAGDEVVTTPYTFFATAGVIHRVGARPVFVDIDPVTYNIDVTRVAAAITPRTRAVMPVHLFGMCVDMDALDAACTSVPIVEDAAQSLGARDRGRRAGSMGVAGCFSFYPGKNLGVLGDGGMVVTRDRDLGEAIRRLRNHGQAELYRHTAVGGNFRLDAIHCAAVCAKLPHLDRWSAERAANAARYDALFHEAGLVGRGVIALPDAAAPGHVFNQYVIRAERRDELMAHLRAAGIGCMVYYPIPLHRQPCFEYLGYREGDFPESERAARETLALPVYPEIPATHQQHVVETIKSFYGA